jgi:cytidylate kinase
MSFEPWTRTTVAAVAHDVAARVGDGRTLVLVDGSGGSGKSTFARRLAAHLPGAALVSTDDVAWHLHPTRWGAEMLDGVVRPWLAGRDVDYRPPGWVAQGRAGSVTATGAGVLVVEGVGAARRELADLASYVVWVNADPELARERCLVRDIGVNGDTREQVAEFHAWWMGFAVPFHLAEKPWDRADLIVDGERGGHDVVHVVRRQA